MIVSRRLKLPIVEIAFPNLEIKSSSYRTITRVDMVMNEDGVVRLGSHVLSADIVITGICSTLRERH